MASPFGHAAVGTAAAAVVARTMDAPFTASLWIGAVVASGLPDLDLLLAWFGKSGPRYHRNASHSILVLGAILTLGWFVFQHLLPGVHHGVFWAWSVSLLTHPVLDVLTTGKKLAARGYGIGVLWPLGRRLSVTHPIVHTPELEQCNNLRELFILLKPEFLTLGPLAGAVLLAAVLL